MSRNLPVPHYRHAAHKRRTTTTPEQSLDQRIGALASKRHALTKPERVELFALLRQRRALKAARIRSEKWLKDLED
jgi:hypothetical protein